MGYEAVIAVGLDEKIDAIFASGQGNHRELMDYLDRRCQKLILGQTLTSDIGDRGSYAAARVHNEIRKEKRLYDLRLVAGTIQRVVDALWRLNGWELPAPRFRWDFGEPVITEEDAKVYETL